MDTTRMGIHTLAIHAGEAPDPTTGALVPPLHLANTFFLGSAEDGAAIFAGEKDGFVYSRWGNPTVALLEKRIAALEHAPAALATASGMAAISTAILNIVRAGDHVIAAQAIYPGTYHLFANELRALGIETTFVDATDPQNIARAILPNTKLIYLESPGNPILTLCDLSAIAVIAREAKIISITDNTFATPINQQPLDFGIDVVVHSATKYFGGHGDAVGGVIVGSREFIKQCANEPLRFFGGILSPFNAYLILRGIQTLPLRMERHNANARAIAQFLQTHRAVEWVAYPGLPSHPQYALAQKQMRGFGGMVCFELKGGINSGARLMNAVKLCSLAVSLGDTRTLIVHPASTTHSVVTRAERIAQGVSDGLVRLSVGLEDVEDIIADLERGLEKK
ncbi:MAG: aminotransferase class I/II-fold pyridoxal phosphate-dependent enzyme [Chloroflexi bacterium]|nr:aminotransferase class I/II-fold pyridoxal phosphate-dependent enzyme [Chloroflexota bacterium]